MLVRVYYGRGARVHMTLTYAPHRQDAFDGSTDSTGLLRLRLRAPHVPLHKGHGTATLAVTATSGLYQARARVRLALSALILSVRSVRRQACSQSFSLRVAYLNGALVRLTIRYQGGRPFGIALRANREGIVNTRITMTVAPTRARRETIVIVAHGQRGHAQQTEEARVTQVVPSSCR